MQRRTILRALAAAPLLGAGARALAAGPERRRQAWNRRRKTGRPSRTREWKQRLTAAQYDVLRHEGTEAAGSSPLNHEMRPGVFACAGCGLPLFSSAMKYDSGTGWPSFFSHIPGAVQTKRDFRLVWPRTEYHCARCGGHQGHVFDDGPPPTGKRWCNNGVALSFLPKAA